MTNRERHLDLQGLQKAAQQEQWELVDAQLPYFVDDEKTLNWVRSEGLSSDNPHLRDLAASIFQGSSMELTEDDIQQLRGMMGIDANPYARYRASFALFTHGQRDADVLIRIREALNDPDVKEIAAGYLQELDSK